MNKQTVKDCLKKGSFKDKDGKPLWFFSERFHGIYNIIDSPGVRAGTEEYAQMGFKSLHPYLLNGWHCVEKISFHLNDLEASVEDNTRETERLKQTWNNLPFENQKKLVQLAYNMGAEVPSEDLKRYFIKTKE